MIRGTMPDMKPGTVLGHEAVGVVEKIGKNVRNLRRYIPDLVDMVRRGTVNPLEILTKVELHPGS